MDDRKIGPAIIVGHAWGNQPARRLPVDRPDVVLGIVMAAASVGKVPSGLIEKPHGKLHEVIDGLSNTALPGEKLLNYLRQTITDHRSPTVANQPVSCDP